MTAIGPTNHAVEALAIFYPDADGFKVIDEVQRGVELEPETAVALVGRPRCRPGSRYVLHRERTGLFVLRENGAVVTFLRFYSLQQHELASRLWPGGDPVSTDLPRWSTPPTLTEDRALTPDSDPGRVYVSDGARDRTGLTKAKLAELVLDAIEREALLPSEGRMVEAGRLFDGCLNVNGQWLGVALDANRIRVVSTHPPPAEVARLKQAHRAQKAAIKAEARRQAGLQQAAELLRKNGWTVIPPGEVAGG